MTTTTIDEKEIKFFENISKVFWKECNFLVKMNTIRIPMLIDHLVETSIISSKIAETEKPLTNLKVLDAGCGGGMLSEALAELGAQVTGLDASKKMIKIADEHSKDNKKINKNLKYICQPIEKFCINNFEAFDVVITSETIEHVANVDLFMENCIKCLKPDGLILVTTINRTTKSWLIAIILYEYMLKIIVKGTHNWYKFVLPEELESILEKGNCKNIFTGGFGYSYFNQKFHFSMDTSVFYYTCGIKNSK